MSRIGDPGDQPRNGRIAFHGYVHRVPEIFTITRGQDQQRLTRNQRGNSTPAWSPDGRRVAFARATTASGFELFTMRADGTDKRRLTHEPFLAVYPAGRPRDTASPTAAWMGTTSRSARSAATAPSGDDVRQVTHNATGDFGASFSPSGRRVAFVSNDIYIKRLSGGPRFRVTHSPGRGKDMPSWSPNGRRLSFVHTNKAGRADIYTIRTDGNDRRRITNTALTEEATDWGVRAR